MDTKAESRAAAREELRKILIDLARNRQTIAYSELARMIESVHLHHRSPLFYRLLYEVCDEEETRGHGMLCALVVRKDSGVPGGGYYTGMAASGHDQSDIEASWRAERDQVFEYWSQH